MGKIKDKRWGVIAGRPDVVMRHIEIPVIFDDEPDRPGVVVIPLSKVPQFQKALARAAARGSGTSALMAYLEDGDGFLGEPDGEPDRTGVTGPDSTGR